MPALVRTSRSTQPIESLSPASYSSPTNSIARSRPLLPRTRAMPARWRPGWSLGGPCSSAPVSMRALREPATIRLPGRPAAFSGRRRPPPPRYHWPSPQLDADSFGQRTAGVRERAHEVRADARGRAAGGFVGRVHACGRRAVRIGLAEEIVVVVVGVDRRGGVLLVVRALRVPARIPVVVAGYRQVGHRTSVEHGEHGVGALPLAAAFRTAVDDVTELQDDADRHALDRSRRRVVPAIAVGADPLGDAAPVVDALVGVADTALSLAAGRGVVAVGGVPLCVGHDEHGEAVAIRAGRAGRSVRGARCSGRERSRHEQHAHVSQGLASRIHELFPALRSAHAT